MTDPRKTPTNDAPVTWQGDDAVLPVGTTVEVLACDPAGRIDNREVPARTACWIRAKIDGSAYWCYRSCDLADLGMDDATFDRLAALASAPAECALCGTGPHDPDCPHHPVYETLASTPAPDWTIERDANGEAMVCTGCGTTRTIDHIRYLNPQAISCCPERKMIPVREAIASAPAGDGVVQQVKDILRGPDGEEYTDHGMEDAFFRWPVIERAIAAALARPRAAVGEREAKKIAAQVVDQWQQDSAVTTDRYAVPQRDAIIWRAAYLAAILALQSPPAKVEGSTSEKAVDDRNQTV